MDFTPSESSAAFCAHRSVHDSHEFDRYYWDFGHECARLSNVVEAGDSVLLSSVRMAKRSKVDLESKLADLEAELTWVESL